MDASLIMIKKKDLAPTPTDLRPISISNTILRVVQRWVAKCMAPVASSNIHAAQHAFLPGRNTFTNVRKVNDFAQRNEGWLLFVDLKKAGL